MKSHMVFSINHITREIEVDHGWTLLELLRDELKLKSVHRSCGEGECGACTVLVDGEPVCACLTLAAQTAGKQVVTLEGLIRDGEPHPIISAFGNGDAVQCGYCTPGVIMTAYALVNSCSDLTVEAIAKGIEGNICRCTGYINIVKAIKAAAVAKESGNWW